MVGVNDRREYLRSQEGNDDSEYGKADRSRQERDVSVSRSRSRSRSPAPRSEYRRRDSSRSRSPRRHSSRRSPSRSRSRDNGRKNDQDYAPVTSRGGDDRKKFHGTRENPEKSSVLGVFGMSIRTTEDDLVEVFGKFGKVLKTKLILDRNTRQSRGFGFVTFDSEESATEARDAMNGRELDERKVRVDYSITHKEHDPTPGQYMGKDRDSDRGRRRPRYGRSRSPIRRRYDRSRSPDRRRRDRSRTPERRHRDRSRSPDRRSRYRPRSSGRSMSR